MDTVAEANKGDRLLNPPYRNLVFRISKVYILFLAVINVLLYRCGKFEPASLNSPDEFHMVSNIAYSITR